MKAITSFLVEVKEKRISSGYGNGAGTGYGNGAGSGYGNGVL